MAGNFGGLLACSFGVVFAEWQIFRIASSEAYEPKSLEGCCEFFIWTNVGQAIMNPQNHHEWLQYFWVVKKLALLFFHEVSPLLQNGTPT